MSITLYLSALTMKNAVEGACQSLGVGKGGPEVLTDLLTRQFSDPSQRLNRALEHAHDSRLRVLELALAGDLLWDRCKGMLAGAEYRAFRQQIQEFLAANPPRGLPTEDAKSRARAASPSCSVPARPACSSAASPAAGPGEACRQPGPLRRQPPGHDRRGVARRRTGGRGTAPPGIQPAGPARLGAFAAGTAVAGRRQPLLLPPRSRGQSRAIASLTFSQLEGLSHTQQAGFEGLNNALKQHQHQLDQMLTGLADAIDKLYGAVEQVGAVATETRDTVLDVRDEMRDLKSQNLALHQAVQKLLEQHQLQSRPVRGNDSLAIQNDHERQAVKAILEQYRRLPEEQRRAAPALLNGLGKLQLAVGDAEGARRDFAEAAALAPDVAAKAEAHFNAYRAALEGEQCDAALSELLQAARLDRKYLPFPLNKYVPEKILGAGGFGVTFRCRYRPTNGLVAVKTLSQEGLDRDVSEVFREAGTLRPPQPSGHCPPARVRLHRPGGAARAVSGDGVFRGRYAGRTRQEAWCDVPDRSAGGGSTGGRGAASGSCRRRAASRRQAGEHTGAKEGAGWQVKLIDFGLALEQSALEGRSTEQLRRSVTGTSIAGTIDYAAPEQMGKEKAPVGRPADVYGFARTCCYALFQTPQPTFQDWKRLPESLAEVFGACLHHAPKDRPADFSVLLPRLRSRATPPPPPPVGESLRDSRPPVGESLRDSRPPVGESLRDSRVPVGESLRDSRPPVGESLRDSRPPVGESLRDSRLVPAAPVAAVPAAPPPAKARLTWTDGRITRTLHLYFTAVLEAGRQTTKPLCLRVEPVTDPVNRDKSLAISSHHFTLRYLGDGVELIDPGSSNGTFVNRQRLNAGQPCWIQPGTSIWLADALELQLQPVPRRDAPADAADVCRAARTQADNPAWLQSKLIGADRPGWVSFLRIGRKNNLPQEEYALLFHAGGVGGGPEALVRVGSGGDVARLLLLGGWPHLERMGPEMVTLSGRPLPPGAASR